MSNEYITPYYEIPSGSSATGAVGDYQNLSQAQIESLCSKDYDKTFLWGWFTKGLSKESRGQILSAWATAQLDLQGDVLEAQATCYAAEVQGKAATNSAIADANARMYEADMNLAAVKEQCNADIKISENELEGVLAKVEVDAEQVDVDRARVDVERIAAEGEAEKDREEGEAKIIRAQAQLYGSDYDYLF